VSQSRYWTPIDDLGRKAASGRHGIRYGNGLEVAGKIGPGLPLYGLRHTAAVILRELGYDDRSIADALGQKTIEMARRYAKGADLKPTMRGVVASFDAELNRRRTKVVNPDGRKGQTTRQKRSHI